MEEIDIQISHTAEKHKEINEMINYISSRNNKETKITGTIKSEIIYQAIKMLYQDEKAKFEMEQEINFNTNQ